MTEEFYKPSTLNEAMKEAGVVTMDSLMGLIMSTESHGLDPERLEQAARHWHDYYENNSVGSFGYVLCHLIKKADVFNLHKISLGFPEHVRLFAEEHVLANAKAKPEHLNNV